eukprot:GHVT01034352.1.p5 GENE.GHVT01034352.1~~GHVT01034352.1.p5  ORF type:complete len:107 (+),score=23.44 GHVT01034352.1:544-864(+)
MHLLPCGMLHKTTANLLGNGVVIHLPTVEKELSHFEQSEPDVMKRVFLAKRAHLVFDFHKLVDGAIEATRAEEGRKHPSDKKRQTPPPPFLPHSSTHIPIVIAQLH